jgi:hypothetical protein
VSAIWPGTVHCVIVCVFARLSSVTLWWAGSTTGAPASGAAATSVDAAARRVAKAARILSATNEGEGRGGGVETDGGTQCARRPLYIHLSVRTSGVGVM